MIDLEDEAAAWSRIRKENRRRVRRAEDAGLEAAIGDDIDAFYPVYAASVKRLGSPPFSRRFFEALAAGFGASFGSVSRGAARWWPRSTSCYRSAVFATAFSRVRGPISGISHPINSCSGPRSKTPVLAGFIASISGKARAAADRSASSWRGGVGSCRWSTVTICSAPGSCRFALPTCASIVRSASYRPTFPTRSSRRWARGWSGICSDGRVIA